MGIVCINHIICTLLYLSPKNPSMGLYQKYVLSYIDPYFNQNWRLFANPSYMFDSLLVKCSADDETWIDPSFDDLRIHHSTRILHFGKKMYIHRNVSREYVEYIQNVEQNSYKLRFFSKTLPDYVKDVCVKNGRPFFDYKIAHARRELRKYSQRKTKKDLFDKVLIYEK